MPAFWKSILIVLIATAFGGAADEPPPEKTSPDPARARQRAGVAESDRTAIEFAREHHPELAHLLERLRRANPREYRAAIQDLSRDRLHLERLRQRAPERYESDLKLWTMDSHIRLLAARAAQGNTEKLRPELLRLLQERQEFRLQRLRQEQERLAARLERIDGEIQRIESRPASDTDVDALLSRVKNRVGAVPKNSVAPIDAAPAGDAPSSAATDVDSTPQTQTGSSRPQD